MAAELLEFDAATHVYRVAGKRIPSVTQVLGILVDFSDVPPAVLENARRRGEQVHAMIDLFNREQLDESSVSDELAPYLDAWKLFLVESGAIVVSSECRVFHSKLGYAGTADLVLYLNGRYVVPDIKATSLVPRTVGAQTSAYCEAIYHMDGSRGRRHERACIHLKNGRYQLHPRRDPADWSLFLSCKNIFDYLQREAA